MKHRTDGFWDLVMKSSDPFTYVTFLDHILQLLDSSSQSQHFLFTVFGLLVGLLVGSHGTTGHSGALEDSFPFRVPVHAIHL